MTFHSGCASTARLNTGKSAIAVVVFPVITLDSSVSKNVVTGAPFTIFSCHSKFQSAFFRGTKMASRPRIAVGLNMIVDVNIEFAFQYSKLSSRLEVIV